MKIKRLLSLLLAVSMTVSVLAVTGMPVLAEGEQDPNWIEQAAIIGLEAPTIDDTGASLYGMQIAAPEGAEYSVVEVMWEKYYVHAQDGSGGWGRIDRTETAPIGEGIYKLWIRLVAEGEKFFDDRTVCDLGGNFSHHTDTAHSEMNIHVSFALGAHTAITQVEITGLPNKAELAGQSGQTLLPTVTTAPADAVYTQMHWFVYDSEQDSWDGFTGTFELGQKYRLELRLANKDGYYFETNTPVQTDGDGEVYTYINDYAFGSVLVEYSLRTEIDTVELSGYTEPVIGATPDLDVQLPEGAPYSFHAWDGDPYAIWWQDDLGNVNGLYQAYTECVFYGTLKAAAGYEFAEEVKVILNGQEVSNEQMSFNRTDDSWLHLEAHYQLEPELIHEVMLTNVPVAEKDKAAPALDGITLPTDANYSLTGAQWEEFDPANWSYKAVEAGQILANGKQYRLKLTLQADPGSQFDYPPVYVNGTPHDNYGQINGVLYVYMEYLFTKPLDSVALTGLSGLTVGSKIPTELKTEEGANYEIVDVSWFNEGTGESLDAETTLKAGESYQVTAVLLPKDGYHFHNWYAMDVTVDGQLPVDLMGGATDLMVVARVTTRQTVDTVSITGITEPVLGAQPTTEGITVAETDKYQVVCAEWIDQYGNTLDDMVYEDGMAYQLILEIVPKDGYEFADAATILLNGKPYTLDRRIDYKNSMMVRLQARYSFCDVVEKVELTLPDAKVGEDIEHISIGNEQNGYYVDGSWQVYQNGDWLQATGKFESGKAYRREVCVNPAEGWEFQKGKTVVTVNGKTVEPAELEYDAIAVHTKFYLGLETVDTIELSGVTLPVIGAKPTVEGITLPKDAEYKAQDIFWMVSDTGDVENGTWKEAESFQEGKYYALVINAEVTGDKVFGDNIRFLVNGKEQGEVTVYSDVATCDALAVFHLVKEEEPQTPPPTTAPAPEPSTAPTTAPSESTKPTTTNPNTGEQSILMPFILLLMLSAAGLMVTAELKKRMAK